jgi:hypothetical protein
MLAMTETASNFRLETYVGIGILAVCVIGLIISMFIGGGDE